MAYTYRVTGYVTPVVQPGSKLIEEAVEFSYDDIELDNPLLNNKPDDAVFAEIGARYLKKSGFDHIPADHIKILTCDLVDEDKT
jgi:hypothetical protein